MKVKIYKTVDETLEAKSFYFKPIGLFKKYRYKSGQFVTVEVIINNRIQRRAYSISSSPHERFLRFSVKRVEKGLVSNFLIDNINQGSTLELLPAAGSFFFDPKKETKQEYILMAAGSGITPILSITKTILEEQSNARLLLFYANKTTSATIFRDEIKQLKNLFRDRLLLKFILEEKSEEETDAVGGFLNAELVKNTILKEGFNIKNCFTYLCGPPGFMEIGQNALLESGVSKKNVFMERFEVPKISLTGKDLISNVKIKYKSTVFEAQVKGNETILQGFINQNISIPFSCRSGQCNTCKANCMSGKIRMIEGNSLDDDEKGAGEVLTCVAYPESPEVELEIVPSKLNAIFDQPLQGKGSVDKKPARRRQKIGAIAGFVIALMGVFLLASKPGESARNLGDMNTGHEGLSCISCHRDAQGTLLQQITSNLQFAVGMRKHPVDFGTQDVDNFKCLDCHTRPNDRHPTERFLEPRFKDAIAVIDATKCVTCHKEHNDTRVVLPDGKFCVNCHSTLEVKNDPLDIPHTELIEREDWESCLQCHDFHGNHIYDVSTKINDTIPLIKVMQYLKGGDDPYLGKKKYQPLSEQEWIIESKTK